MLKNNYSTKLKAFACRIVKIFHGFDMFKTILNTIMHICPRFVYNVYISFSLFFTISLSLSLSVYLSLSLSFSFFLSLFFLFFSCNHFYADNYFIFFLHFSNWLWIIVIIKINSSCVQHGDIRRRFICLLLFLRHHRHWVLQEQVL